MIVRMRVELPGILLEVLLQFAFEFPFCSMDNLGNRFLNIKISLILCIVFGGLVPVPNPALLSDQSHYVLVHPQWFVCSMPGSKWNAILPLP